MPVCEIDLRVGGKWRFVGRPPKGDIPAFYGEFREIAPPERIVYTEIFEPFPDAPSRGHDGAQRGERQDAPDRDVRLPVEEMRDMVLKTGMEKGAALSYDRLEDVARELAERVA